MGCKRQEGEGMSRVLPRKHETEKWPDAGEQLTREGRENSSRARRMRCVAVAGV